MSGSFLSCHFQTEVFVVLVLTDSWNSGLKRGVDPYIKGGEARRADPPRCVSDLMDRVCCHALTADAQALLTLDCLTLQTDCWGADIISANRSSSTNTT
ncbi:hypothetical protein CesoFtcFv8_005253 [Champsocephalus esox]|uniref:Uncharacterized protein n=1 Tax=Champsocephalus esox TaxID=159716 RepID=A0AAN8CPN9_9TELE|nr:hypothetical protein CesoFtcFv8_005253 [Champsocephalus esox]